MNEDLKEALKEYGAGAFIAFGVVLLVLQVVGVYYGLTGTGIEGFLENPEAFFVNFLALHVVGGSVGSYLVEMRRASGIVKTALVTSFLAFLVENLYYLLFGGPLGGGLWELLGLVIGGLLGASISRIQFTKKKTVKKIQPETGEKSTAE